MMVEVGVGTASSLEIRTLGPTLLQRSAVASTTVPVQAGTGGDFSMLVSFSVEKSRQEKK